MPKHRADARSRTMVLSALVALTAQCSRAPRGESPSALPRLPTPLQSSPAEASALPPAPSGPTSLQGPADVIARTAGCDRAAAAHVVPPSRVRAAAVFACRSDSDLPGGKGRNTDYSLWIQSSAGWFWTPLGWAGEGGGFDHPFVMSFEVVGISVAGDRVIARACQEPPCDPRVFVLDARGVPQRL